MRLPRSMSTLAQRIAAIAVLLVVCVPSPTSASLGAELGRVQFGPDGGGGLPRTVGPSVPHNQPKPTTSVLMVPTYVSVYDAITREPVVGALVVVTLPEAGVVALVETAENGIAKVLLSVFPEHELALPDLGITGVPILPGDIMTIVVS